MPRRDRTRRARSALLWAAGLYAAATAATNVWVDWIDPRPADMDYGRLLRHLFERIRERPDDPLVLTLGSSHVASGVRPAELPEMRDAQGRRLLVFNMGRNGAGPSYLLAVLHRLDRLGVRPAAVVAEVSPYILVKSDPQDWLGGPAGVLSDDLDPLGRQTDRWSLWTAYMGARLAAVHSWRAAAAYLIRPAWAPRDAAAGWDYFGGRQDPLGGYFAEKEMPDATAEDSRRHWIELVTGLAPAGDPEKRILSAIVEHCRSRSVLLAFVMTPQSDDVMAALTKERQSANSAWLANLAAEFGVRIVDARNWAGNRQVADGHHMLADGAVEFTRRLGREVIGPLVHGQLAPGYSPGTPRPPDQTVYPLWLDGFSTLETYGAADLRWCGPKGTLFLDNPSGEPLTRRLTMGFQMGVPGKHHLTVDGPLVSEVMAVGPEARVVAWTVTIPPGRHPIRFVCDAPRLDAPNDPRTLVFQVTNFRMTPAE